jgi:hypothetical protein
LSRITGGFDEGWRVRAHGTQKYFSDRKHGGRLMAKLAAVEYLDTLVESHGPVTGGRKAVPKVLHLVSRQAYRAQINFWHPEHKSKKRLCWCYGYRSGRTQEWAEDMAQKTLVLIARMSPAQVVRAWDAKDHTARTRASRNDILSSWDAQRTLIESQSAVGVRKPWREV